LCLACAKSFTFERRRAQQHSRFADDVIHEAVTSYVSGIGSYRSLSKMLSRRLSRPLSRTTLNRWVDRYGSIALTPLELSVRLAPSWSGILGVDGKAIWAGREECSVMLAVDQGTHDIVHALMVPSETAANFKRIIHEAVTIAKYPLKGLVSDAHPGFATVHRDYLAQVPLQLCIWHFDARLDYYIPLAHRSATAAMRRELKQRIRQALYARTEERALELRELLIKDRGRFGAIIPAKADPIATLIKDWDHYMAHHRHPGLPTDNNITENVIRQLSRRLHPMEGFASLGSADRFTRLLVAAYRFKAFTDSTRERNGKAPLELAGVALPDDWLAFVTQPW